jgi:hypothetical protein
MGTFTCSHVLVLMFFEMGNAEGSLPREEFHKIGDLSKKYIDAQGEDFNQVISAS